MAAKERKKKAKASPKPECRIARARANKKKGKRRSPVEITPELLDEAIKAIASGMTLSDFCREPGRPARQSIARVIAEEVAKGNRDLADKFTTAREMGYDAIAEKVLELVDEKIPKDDNGRTDSGLVQQRRLQADVRLRLLSKWCTARYGEKLEVGGRGMQINVVAPIVRGDPEGDEAE